MDKNTFFKSDFGIYGLSFSADQFFRTFSMCHGFVQNGKDFEKLEKL